MAEPPEWAGAEPLSAAALRELMGVGPFALAGRLTLALLYATRWLRRGVVRVPLERQGTLYVNRGTLASDFQTLRQIFVPRKNAYSADYVGATVVDIGAHKGYYGAFALLMGASDVHSYEPAAENYRLLEKAAASFRQRGMRWETRKAAVGGSSGSAILGVSAESWAHSLHATLPPTGPARAVTSEEVEVVAAHSALEEAAAAAGGGRLIVKIDAEGAECEICLQTDESAWTPIDDLFVETHVFAPCDAEALFRRPRSAGLVSAGEHDGVVHLARGGC